jgi:hypothetical protein
VSTLCDNERLLNFAGDVIVNSIVLMSKSGKQANITNQVISIEVFEDIFSPFRTSNLILKESVDYINTFPLKGEEFFEIDIETPSLDKPLKGKFFVYSISDRTQTKNKEVIYTLKGITYDFVTESYVRLSNVYNGNCSELVKQFLGSSGLNTKEPTIIDTTSNKIAFTAGYWSPIKCINHIQKLAINTSGCPSFLFFENKNGYNFKCINNLIKSKIYQSFYRDSYSRTRDSDTSLTTSRDPSKDYQRIMEMSVPETADFISDILNGGLQSQMIRHDAVTGSFDKIDYDVAKDSCIVLMNDDYPNSSSIVDTGGKGTVYLSNHQYSTYDGVANISESETKQKRKAIFRALMKHQATILVPGRTDYTVGQMMELNIPRMAPTASKNSSESEEDYILSGKYMLIALAHYITKDMHRCSMELVKNSVKRSS